MIVYLDCLKLFFSKNATYRYFQQIGTVERSKASLLLERRILYSTSEVTEIILLL